MDALHVTSNRYVDLAFLVPVPPNLMNRDDLNRPKTTTFGGVTRLAPSPQSFKLSLRRASTFGKGLVRTKYLPDYIADKVFPCSEDEDKNSPIATKRKALSSTIKSIVFNTEKKDKGEADKEAKKIEKLELDIQRLKAASSPDSKEINKKEAMLAKLQAEQGATKKESSSTSGLLLVTEEEVGKVVAELMALTQGDDSPSKKALEAAIKKGFQDCRKSSASLARSLFGRMVTNADDLIDAHKDGALQVGFPFSVERARIQTDYFVATDDLSISYREDPGASHLGERPFAGGHTIFLQISVDLNQLASNARFSSLGEAIKTNRKDLVDIVMDVVETSLSRPFAGAAGQGNFRTSPRACAAILRTSKNGSLCDLTPAFESVITPEGDKTVSALAASKMLEYLQDIGEMYGDSVKVTFGQQEDYECRDLVSFLKAARARVEDLLDGAL